MVIWFNSAGVVPFRSGASGQSGKVAKAKPGPANREEFILSLTVQRLKHYCRLHGVSFKSADRKEALQTLLRAAQAEFSIGKHASFF